MRQLLASVRFRDRRVMARRSRGQALVELALIAPIMLLLLLGAIDLGRVFYAQIIINDAAREGALEAARNPTSFQSGVACTAANKGANRVMCRTTTEARGSLVTVEAADVQVRCSSHPSACPATPALGDTVTVQVTGRFSLLTPFMSSILGTSQVTFTSSASAQLNAAPAAASTSAPTASFTASPVSGPAPLSVTLTDASTGTPTAWTWDFGDGQTSASQGPHSRVYTTEGTYIVRLTVSNAGGTTFTTRTITVAAAPPVPTAPVAAFSATPPSGAAPLSVTFADLSTGAPTTWLWAFGDGTTSTSPNPPPHVYASAGSFTVTLQVTNAAGTDTESGIVTTTTPCTQPTASFSVSPTSGRKNSTLFDVTDASTNMSTAGCSNVWSWDFGDGAGSSLQDPPNHQYKLRGTYTIQLTVSNLGGSNSTTRTVTVSN